VRRERRCVVRLNCRAEDLPGCLIPAGVWLSSWAENVNWPGCLLGARTVGRVEYAL
jgi:hypothetical protein